MMLGSSPFHMMSNDEAMAMAYNFECETQSLYDQSLTPVKEEPSTYTCMKNAKSTFLSSARDEDNLTTWTNTYPEHWTSEHILDWLFYVALLPKHNFDIKHFGAEKFQNITGKDFCSMTREEFVERLPEFGNTLFDELRHLLSKADFEEPEPMPNDNYPYETFNQMNNNHIHSDQSYDGCTLPDHESSTSAILQLNRCFPMVDQSPKFVIDGWEYDFDVDYEEEDRSKGRLHHYDEGYNTSAEYPESDESYSNYPPVQYLQPECSNIGMKGNKSQSKATRNPGRPRRYKNSMSSEEDYEMEETQGSNSRNHRGRRQGQSTKGNHLWEFIRDLLKNPAYNNKIIKWEDRPGGVFRFVHSDKVARLWGDKKNNAGMTYEKLSRAMRYYYKREILERVDGRRLVYKFGKNATGWQED